MFSLSSGVVQGIHIILSLKLIEIVPTFWLSSLHKIGGEQHSNTDPKPTTEDTFKTQNEGIWKKYK